MMAVYTQLQEGDIQEIGSRYSLMLEGYETITAGAANSNYVIRVRQERYILTVLEDQLFNQAVELGRLLLLLKERAFPTTYPLFADNGEIVMVHRGKPTMVKEYVEGEVHQVLSDRMLWQVGAATAKLHRIPAPSFLSRRKSYGERKFPSIQGCNIDAEYEAWIARQLACFEQQKPQGLPQGLIHGDIFYDNVLFEDEKLEAIIDFEEAMLGDKMFDLGMGIVGLCRVGERVELEKARALVKGYERVRKLEEREKGELQKFVEYAAATVSCRRYWKYHVDEPSEEKADKHREMVQVAEQIRRISRARFSEEVFS